MLLPQTLLALTRPAGSNSPVATPQTLPYELERRDLVRRFVSCGNGHPQASTLCKARGFAGLLGIYIIEAYADLQPGMPEHERLIKIAESVMKLGMHLNALRNGMMLMELFDQVHDIDPNAASTLMNVLVEMSLQAKDKKGLARLFDLEREQGDSFSSYWTLLTTTLVARDDYEHIMTTHLTQAKRDDIVASHMMPGMLAHIGMVAKGAFVATEFGI